jgi:hypothetical protein
LECTCLKRVEYLASARRSKARRAEDDYQKRLEIFREGIVEGVRQLIARHLYRCGVYRASLDNGLMRNPSGPEVMNSLHRTPNLDSKIQEFLAGNERLVAQQEGSVDAEALLRGVLRQRAKAIGLLEGNVQRELNQVKALIERMERLDRYLASWRENLRMERAIEIKKILDMHS